MGLKSYKKWKLKQTFLEFLAEYGITEDDLRALKKQKEHEEFVEVPNYNDIYKEKHTPEEYIEMFAKEGMEEFYPNGRGRNN